jgi:hypothetical protein
MNMIISRPFNPIEDKSIPFNLTQNPYLVTTTTTKGWLRGGKHNQNPNRICEKMSNNLQIQDQATKGQGNNNQQKNQRRQKNIKTTKTMRDTQKKRRSKKPMLATMTSFWIWLGLCKLTGKYAEQISGPHTRAQPTRVEKFHSLASFKRYATWALEIDSVC